MAHDGKLLMRARERLAERKENNAAALARRREEVWAKVPEIRQADLELKRRLMDVIALAAKGGGKEQVEEIDRAATALLAEKAELLVAAGYPADYLDEIVSCPKCGDSGYLPDGSVCSCLEELYEAEKEAELSSHLKLGEESFADFSLKYYTGEARSCMELTLDNCRRYATEFGEGSPNLLLQGGTGLGKTFLSHCIAKAVSAQGWSVCYETAADAVRAFEEQKFSRDPETYEAASRRVRRILECRLLILDDLGTEMLTSFTQSALYNIVNTRLSTGGKTIISTNLSDEELKARYLPQISSRIFGEYETQFFMGEDIRAIKKEQRYQ